MDTLPVGIAMIRGEELDLLPTIESLTGAAEPPGIDLTKVARCRRVFRDDRSLGTVASNPTVRNRTGL